MKALRASRAAESGSAKPRLLPWWTTPCVTEAGPLRQMRLGRVLIERHPAGCRCSYCWRPALHRFPVKRYGLNIPKGWRRFNAWRVIKLAPGLYVRWTWPRFLFERSNRVMSRSLHRSGRANK